MKAAVLATVLLLAACASRDGFIDQQTLDCAPGQVVSILAGLDKPSFAHMEGVDDQHSLIVLVGNNAHEEIVVTFIRVEQVTDASTVYRLSSGYRAFDQAIEDGGEKEFRIALTGRPTVPDFQSARAAREVVLDVTVGLANGDAYRCQFRVAMQ